MSDHPRKATASHTELDQLLATGDELTEEMLDAIEQRSSVEDISYLIKLLRRALNLGWEAPSEAPAEDDDETSTEES
jgi:hypothetical protein